MHRVPRIYLQVLFHVPIKNILPSAAFSSKRNFFSIIQYFSCIHCSISSILSLYRIFLLSRLLFFLTVTSSLAIDALAQPDLIMVSSLEPDSSTNPALLLTFSLKPSKSANSDLIMPLSPMSRIFQYSPLHITFPVPYIYPFRVLYLHIISTFRLFLSRDFFPFPPSDYFTIRIFIISSIFSPFYRPECIYLTSTFF